MIKACIVTSWHFQETLEKFSVRKRCHFMSISCAFFDLPSCPFSHCSQMLAPPGPEIHLGFPWTCLCHFLCEWIRGSSVPDLSGSARHAGCRIAQGTHIFSVIWFDFSICYQFKSMCREVGVVCNLQQTWYILFNGFSIFFSIIALQCFVNFYCTAKWISHIYIYISLPFWVSLPVRRPHCALQYVTINWIDMIHFNLYSPWSVSLLQVNFVFFLMVFWILKRKLSSLNSEVSTIRNIK